MKKWILTFWILGIVGLSQSVRAQESPDRDYNENILIFTGEVENFIESAELLKEISTREAGPARDMAMQSQVKDLQMTSERIADAYFQESDESNREKFTDFLSTTLQSRSELRNYFIILGNAFASEAQRLLEQRETRMDKIMVWSVVGGVALGLAGGAVVMYFKGPLWVAGVTAIGLAGVVAGAGYSARFYIPVDQSVMNAQDFLDRYPYGEDFSKEFDPQSLGMMLDWSDLNEAEGAL